MTAWKSRSLADLGDWYGGGTPSKARPEFWDGGTIPWLSPKDMGDEVITNTLDYITPEAVTQSATRLVPAGSVAVVVRSGILERTLPIAVVPHETTLNQDMRALVPSEDIDPRWVAWGLRAGGNALLQRCRKGGTTVASIDTRRLMAEEIPIPDLGQQRRIVDLLESHLSHLDAADRGLEAVTGRVAALERLLRKECFDELTRIVGLTKLLDVCHIANGQTPKGVLNMVEPAASPGAVPYYKVGDMNFGDGVWMSHARSYVTLERAAAVGLAVRPVGTVLIPKRGGAIATNKKRILATMAAFDLNTMGLMPGSLLDSKYLWNWLESVDLGQISDGSNVPQINAAQVRRLQLPVPDLKDQREIVTKLELRTEQLQGTGRDVNDARGRGSGLRRSILAAAFTGRLSGGPQNG